MTKRARKNKARWDYTAQWLVRWTAAIVFEEWLPVSYLTFRVMVPVCESQCTVKESLSTSYIRGASVPYMNATKEHAAHTMIS